MADLEKTLASDTVKKDWMIDVLADLRAFRQRSWLG